MQYRNENFFQVIGEFTIFFATLDFFVSELILRIVHREGVTTKLPFRATDTLAEKLRILECLTPEQVANDELLAEIKNVLPEAQAASRERNRYIHDQWVFSPDIIREGKI